MLPDQFRSVLKKRPFVPFVIHMASGEEYEVTHPEGIWQSMEGSSVIVQMRGAEVGFLATDQITDVTFAARAARVNEGDE
jgi:hypothetical protein